MFTGSNHPHSLSYSIDKKKYSTDSFFSLQRTVLSTQFHSQGFGKPVKWFSDTSRWCHMLGSSPQADDNIRLHDISTGVKFVPRSRWNANILNTQPYAQDTINVKILGLKQDDCSENIGQMRIRISVRKKPPKNKRFY